MLLHPFSHKAITSNKTTDKINLETITGDTRNALRFFFLLRLSREQNTFSNIMVCIFRDACTLKVVLL